MSNIIISNLKKAFDKKLLKINKLIKDINASYEVSLDNQQEIFEDNEYFHKTIDKLESTILTIDKRFTAIKNKNLSYIDSVLVDSLKKDIVEELEVKLIEVFKKEIEEIEIKLKNDIHNEIVNKIALLNKEEILKLIKQEIYDDNERKNNIRIKNIEYRTEELKKRQWEKFSRNKRPV